MSEFGLIRNIIVESESRFNKRIIAEHCKEVCQNPRYRLSDGVISSSPKVTYYANTCSILGMSNGLKTFLGHFAPELKTSSFMRNLDEIVKKFKGETGQLSACVNGGYGFSPNKDKIFVDSNILISDIGNILDKNGAEITMISGKSNPIFMDNMAVTNDAFIISPVSVTRSDTPLTRLRQNISREELEKLLEENYDIFEVDPKHNLFSSI